MDHSIQTKLGTGLKPDALSDAALPFYLGLGPAPHPMAAVWAPMPLYQAQVFSLFLFEG